MLKRAEILSGAIGHVELQIDKIVRPPSRIVISHRQLDRCQVADGPPPSRAASTSRTDNVAIQRVTVDATQTPLLKVLVPDGTLFHLLDLFVGDKVVKQQILELDLS